jgi:ABC-type dipeptide/oligopeptide/nickel transport system permease component
VGLLLILLFAVTLRALPPSGYGSMRFLILPALTLGMRSIAFLARMTRSAMLDALSADFVRTARAKGLGERRVLGRHVLRNAMPALVVLLALALPGVVAGSVFVESVFAWPGMGRAMLLAIAARDYPVVMGYAALVIAANLAADLALPFLDPRRRG